MKTYTPLILIISLISSQPSNTQANAVFCYMKGNALRTAEFNNTTDTTHFLHNSTGSSTFVVNAEDTGSLYVNWYFLAFPLNTSWSSGASHRWKLNENLELRANVSKKTDFTYSYTNCRGAAPLPTTLERYLINPSLVLTNPSDANGPIEIQPTTILSYKYAGGYGELTAADMSSLPTAGFIQVTGTVQLPLQCSVTPTTLNFELGDTPANKLHLLHDTGHIQISCNRKTTATILLNDQPMDVNVSVPIKNNADPTLVYAITLDENGLIQATDSGLVSLSISVTPEVPNSGLIPGVHSANAILKISFE